VSIHQVEQVVIIGLARQGTALARFFSGRSVRVVVTDLRPADQLQEEMEALSGLPVSYVLGGHPLTLLDGCDLLCLSGGVPPETPLPQEARRRGIPLTNDSLLTLQLARAPVIGVTGSSGKTTTTTMVGEMLRTAAYPTWVGGNIGTPLIDRIDEVEPEDKLLLELSSFQLQLFDTSPEVAAVLNITPNHLDRHPSMAHYTAAKANIVRWQGEDDVAVLGVDDAVTGRWWRSGRVAIEPDTGQEKMEWPIRARRTGFSLEAEPDPGAFLRGTSLVWRDGVREQEVCRLDQIRLLGVHNVANVLAACAIAGVAGASAEAMWEVATTFTGVAHRLELVCARQGIRWYNDSIATAPERLAAALRAFEAPIVLLAGGRDKHLPWTEAVDLIVEKTRCVVLFGEAAGLIAREIDARETSAVGEPDGPTVARCTTLQEAVEVAARVARPGDVVLLSPGGTSFDAYRDFEERGEHFRQLVEAL
jgi:UDP-N-acetylmuramoylalanine--D-glutamate ligase